MSDIFGFAGGFLLGKYILGEIDIFDNEKSATKHNQALMQFEAENYNKALKLINLSMDLSTTYSDQFLLKGLIKYFLGKYKSAIKNIQFGLELNNFYGIRTVAKFIQSYMYLGLSKVLIEDYENAIEDFNKALEMLETYKNDYRNKYTKEEAADAKNLIFYYRGISRSNLELHDGAIEDFENITHLECEIQMEGLYYYIGLSYFNLGRFENALNVFDELIKTSKTDESHFYNRGITKYNLENYVEAVDDLDKAIELGLNNSDIFYYRGKSKFFIEDFQAAIIDMDKATDKDIWEDQNIVEEDPYIVRGICYYNLGDIDNAQKNLEKAILLNPDRSDVLEELRLIKTN